MDDGSWLSWLFILLLLFAAAWFACAETAFASVNKMRIKSRADRGDSRAKKAGDILDNFDKAITTILICTNITHLASAAIVTVLVRRSWGNSAVAISTVLTTAVVFFAGEMLPKSIAKKYSERFALSFSAPLCFFMRIFAPLSKLLTAIGAGAAKLTKGDAEVTVTEDELYDIIENIKDEGSLDAEKSELVQSALMFADVTAEHILTARVDVAAIDIRTPCEEILACVREQRHSRLPVYEGTIDNVIGILQIRTFLKAYLHEGNALDIRPLLDEAYFVHQSVNIDELLPIMSRKKLNMAIVTDNYGGTLGVVTVEDILEELVGEIWDEDDEVVESFRALDDGSFELDAGMTVQDAFEQMHFEDDELDEEEPKLCGEWAYEAFDTIPHEGDTFSYRGLTVTVSRMKKQRIMKLCVRLPESAEGGESDA